MKERLKKLIGPHCTDGLLMGVLNVSYSPRFTELFKEPFTRFVQSFYVNMACLSPFRTISPSAIQRKGLFDIIALCAVRLSVSGYSKKVISKILKGYEDELSHQKFQLKDVAVLASISQAKAKGLSPHDVRHAKKPIDSIQAMIARVYEDYIAALKEGNSLDFDDLLLFGVKLFREQPKAIMWCRHVLVDEL